MTLFEQLIGDDTSEKDQACNEYCKQGAMEHIQNMIESTAYNVLQTNNSEKDYYDQKNIK